MKDTLFHWPTVWRHILMGAIPFLCLVFLYEKYLGEWSLGALILLLSALLPFVAICWLGYQHWKHYRKSQHPTEIKHG
jgi:hypothetical protein